MLRCLGFTLASAIVTSVAGQTLLKGGAAARESFLERPWDWRSLIGLFLYICAAMLFMYALRRIPLSVAVPFTALTYLGAAVTAHLLYFEPLGFRHDGATVMSE
jgi:multidrug transporter EmrE-like cation transporter